MEVRPVDRCTTAGYPTRSVLDEHPELLHLVPRRWQKNPVALAALTTVCVLVMSSRNEAAPSDASHIAPVFRHGDGVGSFGCKAINPPVYLTEDDARQVVSDEAKRAGLSFAPDASRIPGALSGEEINRRTQGSALVLDGFDSKRKIGYEFVSLQDMDKWENPPRATAYTEDTLSMARHVRNQVAGKNPKGSYALFYDPLVRPKPVAWRRDMSSEQWDAARRQAEQEARNQARGELRDQVRDFIKWLKAQGVI